MAASLRVVLVHRLQIDVRHSNRVHVSIRNVKRATDREDAVGVLRPTRFRPSSVGSGGAHQCPQAYSDLRDRCTYFTRQQRSFLSLPRKKTRARSRRDESRVMLPSPVWWLSKIQNCHCHHRSFLACRTPILRTFYISKAPIHDLSTS